MLGLTACSSIRLGYDNASWLTWRWLDGYVDFDSTQVPPVKAAIGDFYAWHRQTQLTSYAALLDELQGPLLKPTTGAAVCRWQDRALAALQPAIERALKTTADRLPSLSADEFGRIAERNDKKNADFSEDHLQADPQARAKAAFERIADRAERVYGRLDDAQKQLVRRHVARSVYDPARALAERQRRQRDTVDTLQRLQAADADPARRLQVLQALAARIQSSPDPAYRRYQLALRDENCEFTAHFHNATSSAQRTHARETVGGYASDLRLLAAAVD